MVLLAAAASVTSGHASTEPSTSCDHEPVVASLTREDGRSLCSLEPIPLRTNDAAGQSLKSESRQRQGGPGARLHGLPSSTEVSSSRETADASSARPMLIEVLALPHRSARLGTFPDLCAGGGCHGRRAFRRQTRSPSWPARLARQGSEPANRIYVSTDQRLPDWRGKLMMRLLWLVAVAIVICLTFSRTLGRLLSSSRPFLLFPSPLASYCGRRARSSASTTLHSFD